MSSFRPDTLTLRVPMLGELPAIMAFFGDLHEAHDAGASEAEISDCLTNPLFDPEDYVRIALARDRIVGWIDIWDQNRAHERLFLDCRAYPRDVTVYAALLDWAEERGEAIAVDDKTVLRARAESDDDTLAAELERRGFRFIRHFLRMESELGELPAEPEWPQGITVRTFQLDDTRAVYDADMEAFADHWDFVPVAFDEWSQLMLGSATFDPTLWFLAEDGDEIAGISLCLAERRPNTGHVGILGVRPQWRRRGLGRSLLLHSFRELRQRGREKVDLGVDAENLTGAVRLYEEAGMHIARRTDAYEKML
jgi:ribosomal protein S18 acetylase RimI-like enzyme